MSVSIPNNAILLTAPGTAAIAVVRLNGPGVRAFLNTHFSGKLAIGRSVHGQWCDGERVIDDPLIALLRDEVADVCLHGGVWVVHAFLELARREGFAISDRVEPPLADEAVDADNDVERFVLAHLPLARTEWALRMLLSSQATGFGEGKSALYWLLHPPRVAIVGTANVGKSTLANQLFAQQRAITADVPGTTRDWVGELAEINGLAVLLVDTPGVRQTSDPLESQAIAASRPVIEQADAVVLVLDPTQPMTPQQSALLERFPRAIRVINKADRGDWPIDGAIRTVATSGQGVDELRRRIAAVFGV